MHNRKLQVRFHVVDRSMHSQLVLQHPSILYTDTQCVMALLGETATMNSHDFVYVGMNDAVEYISTEIYKHHLDLDDEDLYEDNTHNYDQAEHDSPHDCNAPPPCLPDLIKQTGIDESAINNNAPRAYLYTIFSVNGEKAKKVPVMLQLHYRYRGEALKSLNRSEYFALVSIRPRTERKQRTKNTTGMERPGFLFSSDHPLFATHEQYLNSKQPVVIYSGRQPPYSRSTPPSQSTILSSCSPS